MAFGSSINQRKSARPAVEFGGFGTGTNTAPIEYLDVASYDDFLTAIGEADQTAGEPEPSLRVAALQDTTTTKIHEVAALIFPNKVRCQHAFIHSYDGHHKPEQSIPTQDFINRAREAA